MKGRLNGLNIVLPVPAPPEASRHADAAKITYVPRSFMAADSGNALCAESQRGRLFRGPSDSEFRRPVEHVFQESAFIADRRIREC